MTILATALGKVGNPLNHEQFTPDVKWPSDSRTGSMSAGSANARCATRVLRRRGQIIALSVLRGRNASAARAWTRKSPPSPRTYQTGSLPRVMSRVLSHSGTPRTTTHFGGWLRVAKRLVLKEPTTKTKTRPVRPRRSSLSGAQHHFLAILRYITQPSTLRVAN